MDWIVYIVIGLTVTALIMNYLNYVEIRNLRQNIQYHANDLDGLNKRLRDNEYNDRETMRVVHSKLNGLADNLKYNHPTNKDVNTMYDICNARLNAYFDDFTRECNNIQRLIPLLPLADKFYIKKQLKRNAVHNKDLKDDLKEIERELKDLT